MPPPSLSLLPPSAPSPTLLQGLRSSIPPNFPYLNVEFGISDGFVHVIDDEQKFDPALARSVMIGGLIGGCWVVAVLLGGSSSRGQQRNSGLGRVRWNVEWEECTAALQEACCLLLGLSSPGPESAIACAGVACCRPAQPASGGHASASAAGEPPDSAAMGGRLPQAV